MKIETTIPAALIGGVAGAIAGLIGDGLFSGLFPGIIAGGVVGFLFSLAPRSLEDSRIAVESFSPAGLLGGVVGSVSAEAGWIGGFVSCGIGWMLGLFLPAIYIAWLTGTFSRKDEIHSDNSGTQTGTLNMNLQELFKSDFGMDFPISGGTGNSKENPIVVHRKEPNDYVSVEYGVIRCIGAGRGVDWKILQQTLMHHDGRRLDQVKVQTMKFVGSEIITQVENYYFDITDCLDF
jgi:hypothetical protein